MEQDKYLSLMIFNFLKYVVDRILNRELRFIRRPK